MKVTLAFDPRPAMRRSEFRPKAKQEVGTVVRIPPARTESGYLANTCGFERKKLYKKYFKKTKAVAEGL
jgi:hypothetical protein